MTGRPSTRAGTLPRRGLLAAALSAVALAPGMAAAASALTIYKTESCGCCRGWITTMTRAGYAPKVVVLTEVATVGRKLGVPFALSSCHISTIGGYVVVGHVPPADVGRILRERPKALGLTVPGMPLGSPGMEQPDDRREPYNTLLLLPGGKTRIFARHV